MSFGIRKLICGLLLGCAAIATVEGADYRGLDFAIPRGGNTEKYAPVFDFDGDGCLPAAGISRDGEQNPGIPASVFDDQGKGAYCRDPAFLTTSNILHRYACVTPSGTTAGMPFWVIHCGHFYSLYFEKDECDWITLGACGHTHDWEYVAVWTMATNYPGTDPDLLSGFVTHVCASAHGDCNPWLASDVPFEGEHPMIVYHQENVTTHAMRFAGSNDIANPENPYGTFVTPPLVSWYELKGNVLSNKAMRDLLNSFNYGDATIPLKDGIFLKNLNNFKPPGYPVFTQQNIDASNPNNPVLVGRLLSVAEKGAEYVIDFGQIPMGRHRLIAKLAVMNNVFEPADNLDGDFDTTAAAPYLPTGFNSFTGLAAGDYFDGLIVEIPTAGHGLGVVTGEIVLQPKGQVDTGIRAPQDPITLTMSLEIVPGDDGDDGDDGGGGGGGGLCSLGPKSASAWMAGDLWLLLAFISGLGLWRTRRRKDAAK